MSKLSKMVAVLALVLSLGAHWAVLQSTAWLSMIVRFAQDYPLGRAITMTFDGQHPCALCLFVAEGMHEESQPDQSERLPMQKIECVPFPPDAALFPPGVIDLREFSRRIPSGRHETPPAPPPPFA